MLRFLVCIAAIFIIKPAVVFAAPDISVPANHFDFGAVKQGERVEHVFEVVNTGDEDLVIERLTGS